MSGKKQIMGDIMRAIEHIRQGIFQGDQARLGVERYQTNAGHPEQGDQIIAPKDQEHQARIRD